jgi:hypothetical protein
MKELVVSVLIISIPCLIQLGITSFLRDSRYWMLGAVPIFLIDFTYGLPGALQHFPADFADVSYVVFMEIGRCAYELLGGLLLSLNTKRIVPILLLFLAYWSVWYIYDHSLSPFKSLPYFTWIISFLVLTPLVAFTYFRLKSNILTTKTMDE